MLSNITNIILDNKKFEKERYLVDIRLEFAKNNSIDISDVSVYE